MNADTSRQEIFTVAEAAEFLRCSTRQLQSFVARNLIASSKATGLRTFRREDLIEFWLRKKVNARAPQFSLPADSELLEALWQALRPRLDGQLQAIREGAMAEHIGERAFV